MIDRDAIKNKDLKSQKENELRGISPSSLTRDVYFFFFYNLLKSIII